MAQLRLIFHGLLGVVMRQESGVQVASVLFPKQPIPVPAFSADSQPFISQSHFPFLRFAKSLLDPNSPRKPQFEVASFGQPADCILFLNGERLSLPNVTGGIVPVNDATIPDGATKPDTVAANFDHQKQDFRWTAQMDDIFRGAGTIDPDTLNGNSLKLVEVVFDLRQGTIGCNKLAGERVTGTGTKDCSTFDLHGKLAHQALSEEIFLTNTLGPQLVISSTPLPNSSGTQQPSLVLNADDAGTIECHVFNSELDVIMRPPTLPKVSNDPRDIVQLFELSAVRPPLLDRQAPTNDGMFAGDHICPAGVFRG
jgi:hypothetical protein